jgi:hypothetical protein
LYPITPQKLLKSLDLVVYIENGWSLAKQRMKKVGIVCPARDWLT